MDTPTTLAAAAAVAAFAAALPAARRRLELSLAKHPSLAGHSRWAKRLAGWMPGVSYDDEAFFASDDAPADVVARRREALARLSALYEQRYARSLATTRQT